MSIELNQSQVVSNSSVVNRLKVVVHTLGAVGPNTSNNHWTIYLLFASGGSVRINMREEKYGSTETQLLWTKQAYQTSTSAIQTWDFEVRPGVSVKDFANIIYERNRQHYELSGGGSGCRYWIYTITKDFHQGGLMILDPATHLWPHLLYLYHTQRDKIPLSMVQGSFYLHE